MSIGVCVCVSINGLEQEPVDCLLGLNMCCFTASQSKQCSHQLACYIGKMNNKLLSYWYIYFVGILVKDRFQQVERWGWVWWWNGQKHGLGRGKIWPLMIFIDIVVKLVL